MATQAVTLRKGYKTPLFLGALFLLGSAWAQKAVQPQWKEYAYAAEGFAIDAPSNPDVLPDPMASGGRMYGWQLDPAVRFTLRTAINRQCPILLRTMKGLASGSSGKVKASEMSLNGYPGLESETNIGNGHVTVERLYCIQDRAFSLAVSYPEAQKKPLAAIRMFNSFRPLNSDSH